MGVQSEIQEEGFNNAVLRKGCQELVSNGKYSSKLTAGSLLWLVLSWLQGWKEKRCHGDVTPALHLGMLSIVIPWV
ncbi:hypothetical protein ACFXTN_021441 [Malus domestica]